MRKKKFKLNIHQKIIMRWLKVKVSDDGRRWVASRKHQKIVEKAFQKAYEYTWLNDSYVFIQQTEDGIILSGSNGHMELKWLS